MQKIFFSLILSFFLIGCGGQNSGSNNSPTNSPTLVSLSDGEMLAQRFNVKCEAQDRSKCVSSALYVQSISSTNYSSCSSFIVGELEGKTVMATNIHCLGDTIESAVCARKIAFSFAGVSGYDAETASCERIIKTSPTNSKNEPDYAFILLNKKINRPPMKVSVKGIKNEERLTVVHFNTDLRYFSSVIKTSECESVMDSIFNSGYTSETSPTVALYGCRLIHGNSGSAVLNSDSEVSAILQAGATDENAIENQKMIDPTLREYTRTFDLRMVNIATNFACINFPEIGVVPLQNNQCQKKSDSYSNRLFDGSKDEAIKKVEAEVRTWVAQPGLVVLPQFGIDKNVRLPKIMTINSSPLCFVRPTQGNDWLKKYKRRFWFGYGGEGEEVVSFKMWSVSMQFDQKGRPKISYESGEKYVSIKFNPNDLVKNGASEVTINDSSSRFSDLQTSVNSNWLTSKVFGGLFQNSMSLAFCTPEQIETNNR